MGYAGVGPTDKYETVMGVIIATVPRHITGMAIGGPRRLPIIKPLECLEFNTHMRDRSTAVYIRQRRCIPARSGVITYSIAVIRKYFLRLVCAYRLSSHRCGRNAFAPVP